MHRHRYCALSFAAAILFSLLCLAGNAHAGLTRAAPPAVGEPQPLSASIRPADPLDEWSWRNPLPSGNAYSAVAYGNGIFVAVGPGTILTSSDGITWSENGSVFWDGDLYGVTYGNGLFVAVGYKVSPASTLSAFAYVSQDGRTWSGVTLPIAQTVLYSVAFGNGRFVAVGRGGGNGADAVHRSVILTSRDGRTWAPAFSDASDGLYGITYCNDKFVAVGAGILTSSDGVVWTRRVSSGVMWQSNASYGNGTYVTLTPDGVYTSSDGITWTLGDASEFAVSLLNIVAWGNDTFVAATGNQQIFTSSDGITWTVQALPAAADFKAVVYANNQFVVIGDGTFTDSPNALILTSPDGKIWTGRSASVTKNEFSLVEYGNGMFVAVSNSVFTSTDGVSWTKSASLSEALFQGITYGNGMFVAVGQTLRERQDDPVVYTSPNGVDWTQRIVPVVDGTLYRVSYGNSTFVAVGAYVENHVANKPIVLTSPDGVVWTERAFTGTAVLLNTVYYGNGTFVAAGLNSGKAAVAFTSSDGVKWTERRSLPLLDEFDVTAYGNNTFVGFGSLYRSPPFFYTWIFTSPDGVRWTRQYEFNGLSTIRSIKFARETFVAATWQEIFTSSDGIDWTSRWLPARSLCLHPINAITYGNKSFVGVGCEGSILQSARYGNDLTVVKDGTGSGKVTSSPAGISCGTACSATFNEGTVVTLTATPGAGSIFTGWAGDCTGSGACSVPMDKDVTVTATFTAMPVLSVSPASVKFTKVKNGGTSAAKSVIAKNTGATGSLLNVGAPVVSGPNSAEFAATSTCVAPLARGASCTISVTFSPQSDGPSMSANLEISSDAPAPKGSAVVKLSGSSGPPMISASPLALTFPAVNASPAPVPLRTVMIKNTGVSDLTVTSAAPRDGTDPSFGATSDCTVLAAGESCTVTVAFNPPTPGKKTGWIDILSNAARAVSIKLTGMAK